MLQLIRSYLDRPVMSLRTGGVIARTVSAIINPNNLKIEGFYCSDSINGGSMILLEQDIRDNIPQGLVVNDYDALSEKDDLVRLKEILEIGYELMGKPVVAETKAKIGKVNDYAVDDATLYVQKIYVSQNVLRSLNNGQLAVDRDQIVEITNRKIIIKEPLKPVKAGVVSPVLGT